ncbi:hypothetical protein GGI12_001168 [Dipsacomyces acuminosporus]|nr:hypothetical protein GGI12_001168 [Dipsacomyces acuminosporus]
MKLASIVGILVSAVGVCSLAVPGQGPSALPWPFTHGNEVVKRAGDNSTIRILTQNMFMRPPLIQNSIKGDYKDERLDYFIQHILPNYDVVCLQEMFAYASSRRDTLLAAAEKLGFKYSVVSEKQYVWTLATDGGLVILSKYPIVGSEHHDYQRGKGWDWFAMKGILYAKLAISNPATGQPATSLHVYNTHTQSSNTIIAMDQPEVKIRLSQIFEFHNFLESTLPKYREAGEAVVLAGDFNVDRRTHVLSDPNHYKYEREVEDGKDLSTEGAAMVNIFRGNGIDPKILGSGNTDAFKGKVTYDLHDRLREKLGYNPVTYGNTYVDANGNVQPKDTVLTEAAYGKDMSSIDYIWWYNPDSDKQKNGIVTSLADINVAPNFTPGQVFTQISDHYGVSAQVHFGF